MKRIIEGVTYNTDTATAVAQWEYDDQDGYTTDAKLYQTRGGAFFIVHKWDVDEKSKVYFESCSRETVLRLVERTDNLTILNEEVLQPPAEAVEETAPAATLYIRVPAALKSRVDALASEEGTSANAWAMRCLERCSGFNEIGELLGEIISTHLNYTSCPEGATLPEGLMIEHMGKVAERIATRLGWTDKDLENLSIDAGLKSTGGYGAPWQKHFEPKFHDE
jgi:hypothetical protein